MPPAAPKLAPQSNVKKAPAPDLGDLSEFIDAKGAWASFKVRINVMMVRKFPSVRGPAAGTLRQGDIVEGEVRSGWVLLTNTLDSIQLREGKGKWVLIDGSSLGHGLLLERHVPEPEVRKEFGTALELKTPDMKEQTDFTLQVKPEKGEIFELQCPAGKVMMVQGLKNYSKVNLRFCLKDGELVTAESKWVEAETADIYEWKDDDNYETDMMCQVRAHCLQCPCPAFSVESVNVNVNMDPTDCRCSRCGCNVGAHVVYDPSTMSKEAKKKAAAKALREKPLTIDKAIALPKQNIMSRWSALDCPANQKEWPRLQASFKEVVAWSDVHADMGTNMDHLRHLPRKPETVLILAGDVATKFEIIESSLRLLQQKFGAIFFVPGNHELWVQRQQGLSSVHKFIAILELCEKLGVHTRPAFISNDCAVCPLFSWYKDNLVDKFTRDKANIPFDAQTQWPWDITGRGDTNDAQQHEIADFFASLNARRIDAAPFDAVDFMKKMAEEKAVDNEDEDDYDQVSVSTKHVDAGQTTPFVIAMSHFVPRQECYPGPRRLCGVMGCREIETQMRSVGARCHVFGHSHISIDKVIGGVRYVQHPLGYPSDYHRKTWPMRIWIRGASSAEEDEAKVDESVATEKDTKRITILGGELKWFVWNVVWMNTNYTYAEQLKGKKGHSKSQAAHTEKAKEDERRVAEHKAAILASGLFPATAVEQLEQLISMAGKRVGESAVEGTPYKEIEVTKAPSGIDAKLWKHVTDAMQIAATGICEASLDEYYLRKSDSLFEMNHNNFSQCVHAHKALKLEKMYASSWHRHVAPNPDGIQKTAAEVPDATICQEIWRTLEKEIENCKAKKLERPPGRWSDENSQQWAETFDREAEMMLRAELDGKSLAEMWSSSKEDKELELTIMHVDDPSQRVVIKITNNNTVKQLKDMIVETVGRGRAKDIQLTTVREITLEDDIALSSVENEIQGGLNLAGIDMSESKDVEIRITHAASGVPQAMTIMIRDTSCILDLRKAIQAALGEKSLANCKLVTKVGSTFSSLSDKAPIGCRTEFLFLGCDLPGDTVTIKVNFLKLGRKSTSSLEVESGISIKALAEKIVESHSDVRSTTDFYLTQPGTNKSLPLDEKMWCDATINLHYKENKQMPGSNETAAVRRSNGVAAEGETAVTVTHAVSQNSVKLTVPLSCSILELRTAVMQLINETNISMVKLVKAVDGSMVSLGDTEKLNGRREFKMLGSELPGDMLEDEPAAPPTKKQLELTITNVNDPSQQVVIKIANESLVKELKDMIVQKVGRGRAKDIVLMTECASTMALEDDMALSSVENQILKNESQGGLSLAGIDMSESKDVEIRITHGASDTPQSMKVMVKDTDCILDLRKAIQAKLGERSLGSCKLVKKVGASGSFQSLNDKEPLGGRTEFLFLGRDLPEETTVTIKVNLSKLGKKQTSTLQAESGISLKALKAKILQSTSDLKLNADFYLAQNGTKCLNLDQPVWADSTFECHYEKLEGDAKSTEKTKLPGSDATSAKAGSNESAAKGDVAVTVTHVRSQNSIELTVPSSSSIFQLRQAVMGLINETKLSQVKLVKSVNGVMMCLGDTDKLNGCREFKMIGRELPGYTKAEPVATATEQGLHSEVNDKPTEFSVTVFIERSLGLQSEYRILSGTTVGQLKVLVANDDPTGMIQPDEIALKLPTSSTPLSDNHQLTTQITEVELCC